MWYNKHTTLQWIEAWVMMTVIIAWWAKQTQASWTFYIVVASFAILVLGIVLRWLLHLWRKSRLQHIDVRYLIPQSHYPAKSPDYVGAPNQEVFPNELNIGIGTYTFLLEAKSKYTDVQLDAMILVFDGNTLNKPKITGKDNPYVVERLADGAYRDWWGNINYPGNNAGYLYHGDYLIDGNRVETTGEWHGKLHVQFRVRETIVHRLLDFMVTKDKKDDIAFLKVSNTQVLSDYKAVNNVSSYEPKTANTIMVDKTRW